ncbi:hypothetical protein M9Y10_025792 [Tritrichomonas musculus]|uniref:Ankyrin n=1 Tax=Tritrichomonas musculus TaxID=1915356 RepID=A0ABR2HAJ0_9EUKA
MAFRLPLVHNQDNDIKGHVVFQKYPRFERKITSFQNSNSKNQKEIQLLDERYKFNIYDHLPRLFTITTNNGSYKFNIEMLKDSCSVIKEYLEENPNFYEYHINVDDGTNVMRKFEQMYIGKTVKFLETELPLCRQITKELNLRFCPNNLKYPSSYTPGFSTWGMRNDFSIDVRINDQQFNTFIQEKYSKTFTIVTNSKEYHCNNIGVLSSKVIRELIQKDPLIDRFVYDFDDDFDGFQQICDFFNFKSVPLNVNNMNTLKMIAYDLQITSILYDIDSSINEYEKISQAIDEQQIIIDSINELFDLLYNIKEKTVDSVKNKIIESNWSKSEQSVLELAAFILQVIQSDILLHPFLIELLIELDKEANETNKLDTLLPIVKKQLMLSFAATPLISSFIYKLYMKGFIQKVEITEKLTRFIKGTKENVKYPSSSFSNNNSTSYGREPYLWFWPEIYELIDSNEKALNRCFAVQQRSFIKLYLPDRVDDFKRMRDSGEPDDIITKALRDDDVDTLQSIVSKSENKISNANVPFNIFESFIPNGSTDFINYAAAYGAIKCFKYLLLNHAEINELTFKYAVFGCNIEIIKIVYQHISTNLVNSALNRQRNSSLNRKGDSLLLAIIESAIMKHQNNLFDWICEQNFVINNLNENLLSQLVLTSVKYGNAHSIIELIDKGFNFQSIDKLNCKNIINMAASKGFYKILQLLFILMNKRIDLFLSGNLDLFDANSCVTFGSLSIFKFIIQKFNNEQLIKKSFLIAIGKNCIDIIDYILENHYKNDFILTKDDITQALLNSINNNSNELFIYLIDHFKAIDPNTFVDFNSQFNVILAEACNAGNFEVSKTIVDIILKDDPRNDFTLPFYKAIISESLKICQYFIDKKVFIEYEIISSQVNKLSSMKKDILSLIIQNCTPEAKETFFSCYLNEVIKKENVDLVDYLLNKGAHSNQALFEAVKTQNLDLVNMILNYNSHPSFVNQKSANGPVLSLAVHDNNVPIVKRLLSVPGIDPNLYDKSNITPLISAIINLNIDLVDMIINFYGSNIQSQIWQLNEGIKRILLKLSSSHRKDTRILAILNRLIEIDNIDLNIHEGRYTLLTYACEANEINIVKMLLKLDKVDVNLYAPTTASTPLMIAIEMKNFEIAKLLIECPRTNINLRNYINQTALTIAVQNNLEEIVTLLINDKKFDHVESCLDFAFSVSTGIISVLLFSIKDLDVNYKIIKNVGRSPDISQRSKNGPAQLNAFSFFETTLTNAVNKGDIELIDLIVNHPSFDPIKSNLKMAIFNSIKKNNIEIFNKLSSIKNYDINMFNLKGESLLVSAVMSNNQMIIDEIFKNENFDSEKSNLQSAFIQSFTVKKDFSLDIMNQLYEYDSNHKKLINLNKILPNGKSFFTSIPPRFDNIENLVNFFLDHGADPNIPDSQGVYPLEYAILEMATPFVIALLDSGKVDYSVKCKGNYIPLTSSNAKIMSRYQTDSMKSYLHLAARSNDSQILIEFLQRNLIDVNVTDDLGETPLMDACRSRKSENIQQLFLRDDLDYLHRNNKGEDALKIIENFTLKQRAEPADTKEKYCECLLDLVKKGFSYSASSYAYRNRILAQNKEENKDNENREENKDIENKEENKDNENREENKDIENKEENKDNENREENKDNENKEESKDIENKEESKDIENKEESKGSGNNEESKDIENKEEYKDNENKEESKDIENKEENKDIGNKEESKDIENKEENKDIENKEESKGSGNNEENKDDENREKAGINENEKEDKEDSAKKFSFSFGTNQNFSSFGSHFSFGQNAKSSVENKAANEANNSFSTNNKFGSFGSNNKFSFENKKKDDNDVNHSKFTFQFNNKFNANPSSNDQNNGMKTFVFTNNKKFDKNSNSFNSPPFKFSMQPSEKVGNQELFNESMNLQQEIKDEIAESFSNLKPEEVEKMAEKLKEIAERKAMKLYESLSNKKTENK